MKSKHHFICKFICYAVMFFLSVLSSAIYAQRPAYLTVYSSFQQTMFYNKLERDPSYLSHHLLYNKGMELTPKPTYNTAYGMYLRKSLAKRWTVGIGAQYSLQQQKYRLYVKDIGFDRDIRTRLEYLKIPLFIQYNFIVKEKFSFFAAAGPQVSMLLSERGTIPVFGPDMGSVFLNYVGGAYRDFTFDGMAFIGGEHKLYNNTSFFLQFRGDYAFTDSEKKDALEVTGTWIYKTFENSFTQRPPTHNIALAMSFGLTFKVK